MSGTIHATATMLASVAVAHAIAAARQGSQEASAAESQRNVAADLQKIGPTYHLEVVGMSCLLTVEVGCWVARPSDR